MVRGRQSRDTEGQERKRMKEDRRMFEVSSHGVHSLTSGPALRVPSSFIHLSIHPFIHASGTSLVLKEKTEEKKSFLL